MPYCPNCGKKSPKEFATFCVSCGENLSSLGISITSSQGNTQTSPIPQVTVTPPSPQMHASRPSRPVSRAERLMEQRRNKLRGGNEVELEESEMAGDEVNVDVVQDFESILGGGLELESDGLKYDEFVSKEKMSFNFAPSAPQPASGKTRKNKSK